MAAVVRTVSDHSAVPVEGTAIAFLKVAGRLHARVEEALAPLGMTYRQYRLLASLEHGGERGAPWRAPWMAPAGADDPTVELEERGLVARTPHGVGSTRLELTPSGAASVEAASDRLRDVVVEFGAPLGRLEEADLDRLLGRAPGGARWSTAGRA
jgi:DNA-binding MarR family transcriptional regulator